MTKKSDKVVPLRGYEVVEQKKAAPRSEMALLMSDYMHLRALQKNAREEMWHLFSHHEDVEKEWNSRGLNCFKDLKELVDWEPEDV